MLFVQIILQLPSPASLHPLYLNIALTDRRFSCESGAAVPSFILLSNSKSVISKLAVQLIDTVIG